MFCQSAIDSAQNDHAAIVQSILENKDLNGVHGFLHMCDMKKHICKFIPTFYVKLSSSLMICVGML